MVLSDFGRGAQYKELVSALGNTAQLQFAPSFTVDGHALAEFSHGAVFDAFFDASYSARAVNSNTGSHNH